MKYELIREQQLNCDITTAWDFFSAPSNLVCITPAEMKLRIRSGLSEVIREGMVIDYIIAPLFNIPMKWRTRIEYVDYGKVFIDIQKKGPYKSWHHHHAFYPNADGVLMRDTLNYALPFSFISDFVHQVLVKKRIEDLFDYRLKVLEGIFNQ